MHEQIAPYAQEARGAVQGSAAMTCQVRAVSIMLVYAVHAQMCRSTHLDDVTSYNI
jgi:hypothetical protein